LKIKKVHISYQLTLYEGGMYMARKTVLLVDGFPKIRTLNMETMAITLGDVFKFTEATTHEQALELLNQQSFDLIITNVGRHTGMNGLDMSRRVLVENDDQKIIIMSSDSAFLETASLWSIPNIGKPYHIENFINLVKEAIGV